MPLEYEVLEEGTLVHAVASGNFLLEDCLAYERAVAQDERVRAGYRELYDVSAVESFSFDPEDMSSIAEASASNPKDRPGRRVAIVVNSSEGFQLARLYRDLTAELENVIVFNDEATARIWLGVRRRR